ncbi:hypothetical protein HYY71_02190 [Candidatus Woesearchaeota archaeon]|nr:hypothetical protein [Candidatus Woesearchaeota archaeon]
MLLQINLIFKFYGDYLSPHFFIYLTIYAFAMKKGKELVISVLELSTMEDFEDK